MMKNPICDTRCGGRSAITIVELLVALAIIGLLLSLLIVATQKIRNSALNIQSSNNMRQCLLFGTQYADFNDGLVTLANWSSYHCQIAEVAGDDGAINNPDGTHYTYRFFFSPLDPSYDGNLQIAGGRDGNCSYSFNGQIIQRIPVRTPNAFVDGLTSTIVLSENYAQCGEHSFGPVPSDRYSTLVMYNNGPRPSTFADARLNDITAANCNLAMPPFQIRPAPLSCDPRSIQAMNSSGLLVGLADGSVRTISTTIAPITFWALTTPAGGEPVGDDW